MGNETVIQAAELFNPHMGSKQERVAQVLAIRAAMATFTQAAIDLTDALSFDFDAEDNEPDQEHDGGEEQEEICGHYRIDQRVAPQSILAPPVHADTIP